MQLRKFLKKYLFSSTCSLCGEESNGEDICKKCRYKLNRTGFLKKRGTLYYLYSYHDVKNIIWNIKFKNRRYVSKELTEYIKKAIDEIINDKSIDIIIPVPISDNRYLERGFNQVEDMLDLCSIPYVKIKRIKNTVHMYDLKDSIQRKENISNAFILVNKDRFKNKNILIVDDIVTTGATIEEIKKQLIENADVKEIYCFAVAVAKGYFKNKEG